LGLWGGGLLCRLLLLLLLLTQQALHMLQAPLELQLSLPRGAQLRFQLQLAGLPRHVIQLVPAPPHSQAATEPSCN
jgi:hypothetical protein